MNSIKRSGLFCLIIGLTPWTGCGRKPPMYDLLIRGGRVVDGTGNPAVRADVGIRGEKIVSVGDLSNVRAGTTLDAGGCVVSPGFIDVHTHADRRIDTHPEAWNYVLQGVTTIVGGNCGGSRFPLEALFSTIERQGAALNFASYVGHNTIRREVMGLDNRAPTEEEIERMCLLVDQEMRAGAIGLSTGLEYIPGRFSRTEEIIALAGVIHPYDGIYASHLRDQGEHIREAIEEAVRVGREADIRVLISHIKLKIEKAWGKRDLVTEPIENARDTGMDVYMDEYPYTAGSTGLTSSFPEWAVTGGHETFVQRLKDPEAYQRIKKAVLIHRFESARNIDKAKMIVITRNRNHPEYEGKNLAEILALQGRPQTRSEAADLFIELERDDRPSAIFFQTDEEDVIAFMKRPYAMVASDGSIQVFEEGITHPRAYGTFPRVLARYVREMNVICLSDAIRKMTSLPAQILGIWERGTIRPGQFADITVFNPAEIEDTATYDHPHSYPVGIRWVIVNGKIVVSDGDILRADAGRVLYGRGRLR